MAKSLAQAVEAAIATRADKNRRVYGPTRKGNENRDVIVACFKEFQERGLFPPTFEELASATGLSSASTICSHVKILVREGRLKKHRRHYVLAMPSTEAPSGQS